MAGTPRKSGDALALHAIREYESYVAEHGQDCTDEACGHRSCVEVRRLRLAAKNPMRSYASLTDEEFEREVMGWCVDQADGLACLLYFREGVTALRGKGDHLVREHERREAARQARALVDDTRVGEGEPAPLMFVIRARGGGKTEAVVDWLEAGHAIDEHPYWSRVVLCANEHARRHLATRLAAGGGPLREVFKAPPANVGALPTTDCVFTTAEWTRRRGLGAANVEVAIDNADDVLRELVGARQHLAVVTASGVVDDAAPTPTPTP